MHFGPETAARRRECRSHGQRFCGKRKTKERFCHNGQQISWNHGRPAGTHQALTVAVHTYCLEKNARSAKASSLSLQLNQLKWQLQELLRLRRTSWEMSWPQGFVPFGMVLTAVSNRCGSHFLLTSALSIQSHSTQGGSALDRSTSCAELSVCESCRLPQ